MVINSQDAMPRTVNGLQQAGFNPNQPMLSSLHELAGKSKNNEASAGNHTNVEPTNGSAAGNEKPMGDAAVAASSSTLKYGSFEGMLSDLERMLVVRQRLDLNPPQAFDHIIRMQIEILPAALMENRESSVTRYVERLGGIWRFICSQWNPMDHNGWNEDRDYSAKRIPEIIVELMDLIDLRTNSDLIRDLDPLTALERLARTKFKLFDKHGLGEKIEALIKQRIRALCLALHHHSQGSQSRLTFHLNQADSSVIQMVDAVNLPRADAMRAHKAREDTTTHIQSQTINLKEQLDQANEKMCQAESGSLQHSANLNQPSPSAPIPLGPLTSSLPSEEYDSDPPVTGFGPRQAGLSRFCADHMPQGSYRRTGYSRAHRQQDHASQGAPRRGGKRGGYRNRDRFAQGRRHGKAHHGGHGNDMSDRGAHF